VAFGGFQPDAFQAGSFQGVSESPTYSRAPSPRMGISLDHWDLIRRDLFPEDIEIQVQRTEDVAHSIQKLADQVATDHHGPVFGQDLPPAPARTLDPRLRFLLEDLFEHYSVDRTVRLEVARRLKREWDGGERDISRLADLAMALLEAVPRSSRGPLHRHDAPATPAPTSQGHMVSTSRVGDILLAGALVVAGVSEYNKRKPR